MRKLIALIIVIILVIIVMIFLCRKIPEKKEKKSMEPIIVKSAYSSNKNSSRNLAFITMPNHVKIFFELLLNQFDGETYCVGIKNYGSTVHKNKQFQWELYIPLRPGKINLSKWYDKYTKIFSNNFEIDLMPENKNVFISVDVDNDTPTSKKLEKLNLYYLKTPDFPSNYTEEITFKSKDSSRPNEITLRGKYFLGLDRNSKLQDHMIRLGISQLDLNNLINYITTLKFPHTSYSIVEKSEEIGLYISPINYETFLKFLQDYSYDSNIISYVRKEKENISKIRIEIGFYFKKGDQTMKPRRSAFYFSLN